MKRQGTITVFLSLILLIFLNFTLTTLEAAGVTAGRHYFKMLADNAGNAIEGRYYYPLFQQYGLLAMDAGMGTTFLNYERVQDELMGSIEFACSQSKGGLIAFSDCILDKLQLKTLVSDNFQAFTEEVRNEALYEGAELLCDFLKDNSLETVGKVAELTESQQEAGEAVAAVSIEILKLMELVDGVATDINGIKTDKKGNYEIAGNFVKKFCGLDESVLEASYGSQVIYEAVKESIFFPSNAVDALMTSIDSYEKEKDPDLKANTETFIISMYKPLRELFMASTEPVGKAIIQAETLEKVQKLSQSRVLEYEEELLNSSDLSEGILAGLLKELEGLKDFVGLNEKGYNARAIKDTLLYDLAVLQSIDMPDIGEFLLEEGGIETEYIKRVLADLISMLSNQSFENLRFDYGNLKAADTVGDKLKSGISKIFSGGVTRLLGLKDVSEKTLNGANLPSKGKSNKQSGDILQLFSSLSKEVFGKNPGELLRNGFESLSDDFLMEVYLANHFSDYRDSHNGSTKIDYEREYILQGHMEDSENIAAVAMSLIALRAVFCMVALMSDSTRMAEVTALAQTMAVFGIPALCYAAKYLILTVWAIEEAVVEVSALMSGKRLTVFNPKGNVKIQELLMLTPELVGSKARSLSEAPGGIGYSSYITILSFLQGDRVKKGRTLDLIQENIRYRYRDSFRIGNCLVAGTYEVSGKINKKFPTDFFSDKVYEIKIEGGFAF